MDPKHIIRFNDDFNVTDALGIPRALSNDKKSIYRSSTAKGAVNVSLPVIRCEELLTDLSGVGSSLCSTMIDGGIGVVAIPDPQNSNAQPDRCSVGEFHHSDGFVYIVLFSNKQKKLYFVRTTTQVNAPVEPIMFTSPTDKKEVYKCPTEYILATLHDVIGCDPEFQTTHDLMRAMLANFVAKGHPYDQELLNTYAARLTDNLYYRMGMKDSLAPSSLRYLLETDSPMAYEFNSFSREFLDSLEVNTVICGSFQILRGSAGTAKPDVRNHSDSVLEAKEWFKAHKGKYTLNPSRVLTDDEKRLVPVFDENVTPNKKIAQLAKVIHSVPDARELEFYGPAGGGKSVGAKMLAFMLGVPYRVFTCSPGLDESDLFGHYTPCTDPEKTRNLSASTTKKCRDLRGDPLSIYNVATKILRFPDLKAMKANPRSVYEAITGQRLPENKNVPAEDVMLTWFQLAAEEYASIVSECQNKGGKSLVFVKSQIVKALENGDLVEIQEQNALSPGALLGFNDLRDRNSSGYQLPNGENLKRNPNAIIVMTSNVEYEGCRPMNSSVVSRSNLSVSFPALTTEEMVARAKAVTGFADDIMLAQMAEFIKEAKNIMTRNAINDASDIGMRELINWCRATQALGNAYHACEITVINKVSYLDECKQQVRDYLDQCIFVNERNIFDEEAF